MVQQGVNMAQFNHVRYEELERAIANRSRIAVYRRGTEYVVIPRTLRVTGGREAVDATHPTTGEQMTFYVDEMQDFEVIS
jgi:hypothetical protein